MVRDVQLWKTPPHPELFSNALSCDPFSNVTVCRAVQRLKVPLPIVFTPAGIEIETNEEPQKACVPIAVSVLGRVALLILVHFKNASVGKTERFTLEISRCSKLWIFRNVVKSDTPNVPDNFNDEGSVSPNSFRIPASIPPSGTWITSFASESGSGGVVCPELEPPFGSVFSSVLLSVQLQHKVANKANKNSFFIVMNF